MPTRFPVRQKGAALLVMLLVILSGVSYMLVHKLNQQVEKTRRVQDTREALSLAKIALINYAAAFPDRDNDGSVDGPGYLPCPDRDNDGDWQGWSCSLSGGTTIGRLPFETLELPELRDGSGERLWYIVSENYQAGSGDPVNPQVPGNLNVDINADGDVLDTGESDIVAVIIAPGAPVEGQEDRDSDANNPAEYLDGENSNADIVYTTSEGSDFNDIVAFITRTELMQLVMKRVMAEVQQNLNTYYTNNGFYPWLADYSEQPPSYTSKVDNCAGILPSESDALPAVTPPDIAWDLTTWLVDNKWQQYVLVAYSDDSSPSGSCTPSHSSLTVDGMNFSALLIGIDPDIGLEGQNTSYQDGVFESSDSVQLEILK